MLFQTNALNFFHEDHWYIRHIYLNHCLRLPNFPKPWKKAKFLTLLKPGKGPKFPQHLRSISLLSTTGKLYEKLILKEVQRHIEEKVCLMQASLVSVPVTAQLFNV
jgi:hypothetical protein